MAKKEVTEGGKKVYDWLGKKGQAARNWVRTNYPELKRGELGESAWVVLKQAIQAKQIPRGSNVPRALKI